MSKPWKYALVQHPMWLIIAEDSICAERTPPWGCPSIEEYARRLGLCLDALERFPELHLNFDFSAVELEDVAKRTPDLMAKLQTLTAGGRISFVNGTYSQPHLQMLSIESAIRQFQYGLRSIEDLLNYRITCYAAQEPGYIPQLPQLLRALGYDSATTPDFPLGVRLEGGQIQHCDKKWEWAGEDDLVSWKGTDGTNIPLWLKSSGCPDEKALADDHQHGLLHRRRLRVDMPDMIEVTPDWVQRLSQIADFTPLDRILHQMSEAKPPEATAYVDANYAYTEGVDAEALSRANVQAESALLSLETLQAFLGSSDGFDMDAAWKTFLKAQHHDAYWTGAPELRSKAISWLEDLSAAAENEMSQLAASIPNSVGESVLVLHPYARKHKIPVSFTTDNPGISLTDGKGRRVPVQTMKEPDGTSQAVFVAAGDGIGYRAYSATACESSTPKTETLSKPYTFSNAFYSTTILPDGTFKNGLTGNRWTYQEDGKDSVPDAITCQVTHGLVLDIIESSTRLGVVNLEQRISLYHDLPWFEVEARLSFDEPVEIGDFFDDRTKLHYAWFAGKGSDIRHAVGGCPASARVGRSFVVSPWINIGTKNGGFAICLHGAAKCWVDQDGWLRCLVGWGHNGDRFHNRQGPLPGIMGPLNWTKPMDLRLKGEHVIRYAVKPYSGKLSDFETADWTQSLHLHPRAYPVPSCEKRTKTLISLRTPGLLPLSVRRDEDETVLRMMEMDGKTKSLNIHAEGYELLSINVLDGSVVRKIAPHKIVEARLKSKGEQD